MPRTEHALHTMYNAEVGWNDGALVAVGAVIGFGLVFGGGDAIVWSKKIDEFPYVSGLVPVVSLAQASRTGLSCDVHKS